LVSLCMFIAGEGDIVQESSALIQRLSDTAMRVCVRMGAKNSDVYLRCLMLKTAAILPEEWLFQEFKTCKKGEYYTSLASFPPSLLPEGINLKCMQIIHHAATIVFNNLCGLKLIEAKKKAPKESPMMDPVLEPVTSHSSLTEKDLTALLMNLATFEGRLEEVRKEGGFPLSMYYFLKLQTILCKAEGYKLLGLQQQSVRYATEYATLSQQVRTSRDIHIGVGIVWGDQAVLELFRQQNKLDLMARHLEVMKTDASGLNAIALVRKAYLPVLKSAVNENAGIHSTPSPPTFGSPFASMTSPISSYLA